MLKCRGQSGLICVLESSLCWFGLYYSVRICLGVDTDRLLRQGTRPDRVHLLVHAPAAVVQGAYRLRSGKCGYAAGPAFGVILGCIYVFFAARVHYKVQKLSFSFHVVVGTVHKQILLELAFCVVISPVFSSSLVEFSGH